MAALTAERATPERDGKDFVYPVAAATTIFKGSMVALDAAGRAVPVSATTGLVPVGRAEASVDNSGGLAGALSVRCRRGAFKFANGATGTITIADIGASAYGDDDQTVSTTSTGQSVVGQIVQLDTDGVWVKFA